VAEWLGLERRPTSPRQRHAQPSDEEQRAEAGRERALAGTDHMVAADLRRRPDAAERHDDA